MDSQGRTIKEIGPDGMLTYTFYDDVIDNAVLRREYAYDTLGNTTMLTQYDAAEGGNIVNQVLRTFNGFVDEQVRPPGPHQSGAATVRSSITKMAPSRRAISATGICTPAARSGIARGILLIDQSGKVKFCRFDILAEIRITTQLASQS